MLRIDCKDTVKVESERPDSIEQRPVTIPVIQARNDVVAGEVVIGEEKVVLNSLRVPGWVGKSN